MATNVEVRKWLLDTVNRGDLDGHFLHSPLERFHLLSWATIEGETDITHLASKARRLWLFEFRIGAREEAACRTVVAISCPERYRLLVAGQRVVQHHVELTIYPGSLFSERPDYQIIDEDVTIGSPFRYIYNGHAAIGPTKLPIQGALDLV
jgi:hypothetical protein